MVNTCIEKNFKNIFLLIKFTCEMREIVLIWHNPNIIDIQKLFLKTELLSVI